MTENENKKPEIVPVFKLIPINTTSCNVLYIGPMINDKDIQLIESDISLVDFQTEYTIGKYNVAIELFKIKSPSYVFEQSNEIPHIILNVRYIGEYVMGEIFKYVLCFEIENEDYDKLLDLPKIDRTLVNGRYKMKLITQDAVKNIMKDYNIMPNENTVNFTGNLKQFIKNEIKPMIGDKNMESMFKECLDMFDKNRKCKKSEYEELEEMIRKIKDKKNKE